MPDLSKENVLFSIDQFLILREISRGNFGDVFLAFDTELERFVVLKRLPPRKELTERDYTQFIREASLASTFDHPSIVSVYSYKITEGSYYYTMPYLEGKVLEDLIAEVRCLEIEGKCFHRYPLAKLLSLFVQVCEGVAYMHAKNIMHRNLTPSNIIVTKEGRAVILDLGLSLSPEDADPRFLDGTAIYMAPEQVLSGLSSFQSDIYSLGLILYEILTLRRPFCRHTLGLFKWNLDREVLLNPLQATPKRNIPPVFADIALKCLQQSPEDRFQNVQELLSLFQDGLKEMLDAENMAIEQKIENVRKAASGQKEIAFQEARIAAQEILPDRLPEEIKNIFHHLRATGEPVPCFLEGDEPEMFALYFAFALKDAAAIEEIADRAIKSSPSSLRIIEAALLSLIELGRFDLAQTKLDAIEQQFMRIQAIVRFRWLRTLLHAYQTSDSNVVFSPPFPKILDKGHHNLLYMLDKIR